MSGVHHDPYLKQRAEDSFLDTLFRGHAEAAWAIMEIKMLAQAQRTGGFKRDDKLVRLRRIRSKLDEAARHIKLAAGRA